MCVLMPLPRLLMLLCVLPHRSFLFLADGFVSGVRRDGWRTLERQMRMGGKSMNEAEEETD